MLEVNVEVDKNANLRGKWIVNVAMENVNKMVEAMKIDPSTIVIGPPKQLTDKSPQKRLLGNGFVGIYERNMNA